MVTDTPSGGATTNFGYNTDTAVCWSGTRSPTGASCASPPAASTTYGNNAINERCWSDKSWRFGVDGLRPPAGGLPSTTTYGYTIWAS